MSLVKIFRREADRLRHLAATASCDADVRRDYLNQAQHYDVLASQAESRQLSTAELRGPVMMPIG